MRRIDFARGVEVAEKKYAEVGDREEAYPQLGVRVSQPTDSSRFRRDGKRTLVGICPNGYDWPFPVVGCCEPSVRTLN